MKSLCLALCLLSFSLSPAARAAGGEEEKVTARLREFYAFYVHALNADLDMLKKENAAKLKPYITARFLHAVDKMRKGPDGLDGDPYIDAQDWGKDWGKNVTVQNIKLGTGGHATAEVVLQDKEWRHRLHVKLATEDGVYKIDGVQGEDEH